MPAGNCPILVVSRIELRDRAARFYDQLSFPLRNLRGRPRSDREAAIRLSKLTSYFKKNYIGIVSAVKSMRYDLYAAKDNRMTFA
jgi:hypothetical protein